MKNHHGDKITQCFESASVLSEISGDLKRDALIASDGVGSCFLCVIFRREMAHDGSSDIPLCDAEKKEKANDDGNHPIGVLRPKVLEPGNCRCVEIRHKEGDNQALKETGECRVECVGAKVDA